MQSKCAIHNAIPKQYKCNPISSLSATYLLSKSCSSLSLSSKPLFNVSIFSSFSLTTCFIFSLSSRASVSSSILKIVRTLNFRIMSDLDIRISVYAFCKALRESKFVSNSVTEVDNMEGSFLTLCIYHYNSKISII